MIDSFTPMMRALVAGSLLLASATLMLVAMKTVGAAAATRMVPCFCGTECASIATPCGGEIKTALR